MFHGISPSPKINMKFKDQKHDPVNGNDFISEVFDANANCRRKHFKWFFALAYPRHLILLKKTNLNHKADDFFKHFNKVSLDGCNPGMNLATDEQDQRFVGRGEGTICCKFKREGDGYFMDSMREHGHTLSFCPRNQPPPNDWRRKGYSPMRSRILFMRDQLEPNS